MSLLLVVVLWRVVPKPLVSGHHRGVRLPAIQQSLLVRAASCVVAPTFLAVTEDHSFLDGIWIFLLQPSPHIGNVVVYFVISSVLKPPAVLDAAWQLVMQVDIMKDIGLLLVEAQHRVALLWAKVEMLVLLVAPPLMILIESLDVQLPVLPDLQRLRSVGCFLASLGCIKSKSIKIAFGASVYSGSSTDAFCIVVNQFCPLALTFLTF